MLEPRSCESEIGRYKQLLRVWCDWCSTGIWVIDEPMQKTAGANADYEDYDLPDWLVARFDYWTDWWNSWEPWQTRDAEEDYLMDAYVLSLAMDLKRVLGPDYYVEVAGKEIHHDYDKRRKNAPDL